MSRYQALRAAGCDPLTAGFIALMNRLFGVPPGVIVFMNVVIDYDPDAPKDKQCALAIGPDDGCEFGPFGPNGERMCQHCGAGLHKEAKTHD